MPFLPDPSDPLRASPTPPDGYTVRDLLGRGGFGSVWKAEGHGGAPCALKFISLTTKIGQPELRSILKMKGIKHVYLVPLHNIWLRDSFGRPVKETSSSSSAPAFANAAELVIAMGLGTGTLASLLENYRKRGEPGIPPAELLRYMLQAAEAIDFLNEPRHDLGGGSPTSIHHCDIKPVNILTTHGGVWVCDFGIARFRRQEGGNSLHSMTGTETGLTPPYAPPELILSKKDYTNTDQYSLAITYYELRTGQLPFSAEDLKHYFLIFQAHVEGRLDFRDVPDAERAILKRATAVKQEDRFPTAVEMVEELFAVIPNARRPGSSGRIQLAARTWAPAAEQEIVPGYRLRSRLKTTGDDVTQAWSAEADGLGVVTLEVLMPLASDPAPVFAALERLKAHRHPGVAELAGWWALDAQGKVLAPPATAAARALVVATRPSGPGRPLLKRLQDLRDDGQRGIPRSELLAYLRQIAETLDALHAPGLEVEHGDVRPESLYLLHPQGAANRMVLSHLGAARVLENGSTAVPRERGGASAIYRPPETLASQRMAGCDQYGLAVTYYHLRCGRPPRSAGSAFETAAAIQSGRLNLDDLPAPEQEVIERATHPMPAKRFASCVELIEALDGCPPLPLPDPVSHTHAPSEPAGVAVANQTISPDEVGDGGTGARPATAGAAVANAANLILTETKALVMDTDDFDPPSQPKTIGPASARTITPMLPEAGHLALEPVAAAPAATKKAKMPLLASALLVMAFVPLAVTGFWLLQPSPALRSENTSAPSAGQPERIAQRQDADVVPAATEETGKTAQTAVHEKRVEAKTETHANATPAVRSTSVAETAESKVDLQAPLAKLLGTLDKPALTRADLDAVQAELRRLPKLGKFAAADHQRLGSLTKFFDAAAAACDQPAAEKLEALTADLAKVVDPGDRAALAKVPALLKTGLATEQAKRVRKGLGELATAKGWEAGLKACEWAESTVWVRACTVECLAELVRTPDAKDADRLRAAVQALDAAKDPEADLAKAYVAYVRLRAAFALSPNPATDRSLATVAQAVPEPGQWPDDIKVPNRLNEAGDDLSTAARALRDPASLLEPFKAADAATACDLFERSQQFKRPAAEAATEFKLQWALASWCRRPQADNRHGLLARELLRDKGADEIAAPDRFSLLLISAEASSAADPTGRGEKVRAYLDALTLARVNGKDIGVDAVNRGVFAPAGLVAADPAKSAFGKDGPPAQQGDLATLYATAAQTIRAQRDAWAAVPQLGETPRERSRSVARLYAAAAGLEDECANRATAADQEAHRNKQAEYIVQEVTEGYEQRSLDAAALQRRVEDAIRVAPGNASGYILKGAILTVLARTFNDYADRVALLKEADKDFGRAIARGVGAGTKDGDLLNRSRNIAYVELGNFVQDAKERRDYLHGAMEAAEKVAARSDEDWLALGNSCEDVAWLLREPKYYPRAIEAFGKASLSNRAIAPLSRGRAQIKWAQADHAAAPELLRKATADLASLSAVSPAERAEVAYWQAAAWQLRRDLSREAGPVRARYLTDAKLALEKAVKAARTPTPSAAAVAALGCGIARAPDPAPDWAEAALKGLVDVYFTEGRDNPARFATAEQCAGELDRYSPALAAYFRGEALMYQGRQKDAVAAFTRGLAARPRLQDFETVRKMRQELLAAWCANGVMDGDNLERAVADAKAAVRLETEARAKAPDVQGLAVVYGRAGLLHRLASILRNDVEADRDRYRDLAIQQLLEAVKLVRGTPCDEAIAWCYYGALLLKSTNRQQEALELAKDADGRLAKDSPLRPTIQALLKDLQGE